MKSFSTETLSSKLFYSKVSIEFLRQDLPSPCSFGEIQNVGDLEPFEEKT